MSKKAVIEVRENAQKRKNEYFVKGFDITESVEFLLAEVEKDYEFKKQVELQCGLHSCNDILNKQAEKYRKQIADLEAKLAEMQNEKDELISKYRYWKGECAELKEQLAEKDKAIENWRYMYEGVMQSCHNGIEEDKRLEKLLAEKENTIINLIEDSKISKELLNKQLQEIKNVKSQELAEYLDASIHKFIVNEKVKLLERVKEEFDCCYSGDTYSPYQIADKIDEIIAELTHKHEDKGE